MVAINLFSNILYHSVTFYTARSYFAPIFTHLKFTEYLQEKLIRYIMVCLYINLNTNHSLTYSLILTNTTLGVEAFLESLRLYILFHPPKFTKLFYISLSIPSQFSPPYPQGIHISPTRYPHLYLLTLPFILLP